MAGDEKKGVEALSLFGVGTAFGTAIGALLTAKPAAGAAPDEKLEYLITVTEAIGSLLTQINQSQIAQLEALQAIAQALGGMAEGGALELTIKTPWVGKEPVELLSQSVRAAGVIDTDFMVNWVEGKRLLVKAESSLDQAVQLQPMGNIDNTMVLATNIGPPVACPANGNASIGFAWDDWQPYIGVRITIPVAPTVGIITIRAVVQE